jgi:hypothetical protein
MREVRVSDACEVPFVKITKAQDEKKEKKQQIFAYRKSHAPLPRR